MRVQSAKNDTNAYEFASAPVGNDYCSLADHIAASPEPQMHSSLWPRRGEVAKQLRRMGQEPQTYRAAYHALRLMLW